MATILVLDDDPQCRAWLRAVLEEQGHRVFEAQERAQGLTRFDLHQPDLVVLDVYLPAKEGLDIILMLRKKHPTVKILVISGHLPNGHETFKSARALGAGDALAKPFTAETFLDRVDGLLKHI